LLGICVEVEDESGFDVGASDRNGLDIAGCDVLLKEAPQLLQNIASSVFNVPHFGQVGTVSPSALQVFLSLMFFSSKRSNC